MLFFCFHIAYVANTTALDLHFEADTLDCTIIKATHNQYSVKLVKNGEDVAAKIIEASFAVADGKKTCLIISSFFCCALYWCQMSNNYSTNRFWHYNLGGDGQRIKPT